MKLTPEQRRTLRRLLAAGGADVVALGRIAGFDPGSDYRYADWRGADFGGHDLSGFDFAHADVSGANFAGTRGLRPSMFAGAVWDGNTAWPPGFAPVRLTKPGWADGWGSDKYGLWASFSLTGADGSPVTQRLRWIPPGRFLMGSPPEEEERFDNGGPQHEVTIAAGFWLFDTPCTQALWEAVMGDNPSRFLVLRRAQRAGCVPSPARPGAPRWEPGLSLRPGSE